MTGIYKITNLQNNKVYIGQSINIKKRWAAHKTEIYKTKPQDSPLYRAFIKYGIDNFSFEVIEECPKERLDERERYWIARLKSHGRLGYNQTDGGDSSFIPAASVSQEEVLQIIKILRESTLTQQNIAELFHTSQATISTINTGFSFPVDGVQYPIRSEFWYTKNVDVDVDVYCRNCKVSITKNTKNSLCVSCTNLQKRTVVRPDRQELKSLIRKLPFTQIAKKFGVSDNAIRKWCDSYQLPRHSRKIKKISEEDWVNI